MSENEEIALLVRRLHSRSDLALVQAARQLAYHVMEHPDAAPGIAAARAVPLLVQRLRSSSRQQQ